jgi:hypothetical protein
MKRVLILTAVLAAVACAGWKWGGSAQGAECFNACGIVHFRPSPPAPPGPCSGHGGVAWVAPGLSDNGEILLYYHCMDGSVEAVRP